MTVVLKEFERLFTPHVSPMTFLVIVQKVEGRLKA